jgi:energy-coupling factor transporter ATP-binding protein EcfA2
MKITKTYNCFEDKVMILRFEVENYKSIKNPLVFDWECSALKDSSPDNLIKLGKGVSEKKIVAIYGANASGKSNAISSLAEMGKLVVASPTLTPGSKLDYHPFLFDENTPKKPTRFAISLSLDGIRYDYAFAYDGQSIVSEKLAYAPHHYTILVYERRGEQYRFGNEEKALKPYVALTSQNKLFLGTAASFNQAACRAVFAFFAHDLLVDFHNQIFQGEAGSDLLEGLTSKLIAEASFRDFALSFLQAADLGIDALLVKDADVPTKGTGSYQVGEEKYGIYLSHRIGEKSYLLPLEQESDGTKSILFLSYFFALSSEGEKVLLVDELDQSLHTLLIPFLVNLFAQRCLKSQFIFTTHDPSLLRESSLRRDEYYFTEKGDDAGTSLFSLHDFSVRKNAGIEDEYLKGRYGAIPFIKDGLLR